MTIYDTPIHTLTGESTSLEKFKGETMLIVNVASKCGLTPQYEGLEKLQETYGARGFSVLGFPCNQFAGQEPGTAEEIQTFCSTTYGVTFPMFEKIDVNGAGPESDLRPTGEGARPRRRLHRRRAVELREVSGGSRRIGDALCASGHARRPQVADRHRDRPRLTRTDRAMQSHVGDAKAEVTPEVRRAVVGHAPVRLGVAKT